MADRFSASLGGFAHAHRNAIVYAAFGAVVFVASLAATFPYAATLTALLRPLSLGFSSSGQGLSLPLGAALSDVRVVALEPETGRELWRFEMPVRGRSMRAVAYWMTTHSARLGDQIPTRSTFLTPLARSPRAARVV